MGKPISPQREPREAESTRGSRQGTAFLCLDAPRSRDAGPAAQRRYQDWRTLGPRHLGSHPTLTGAR